MHIRWRTGRSQTAKETGIFGALTAILSNMKNKHYNEEFLSRIDFMKEFSSITKEELEQAQKLIRPNPCDPIIRNDRKRMTVLHDLVRILEKNETLPAKELMAWIEAIKI